jgi:hypothetical protein
LVFDHTRGELLQSTEYTDAAKAVAAYSQMERQYEGRRHLEIVLIGAESLATVKRTHANYFTPAARSEYLRDL